jgi:hypothetical protein
MTRFTPLWQQGGSYAASVDRALMAALWPTSAANGPLPTTVANTMNVSIPAGFAAVALQAGANTALCRWDAAEVVTSPAAPPAGNTRIDVVVLQVRDPQLDAGVNNDFVFQVIAGTASTGTPAAPAVPANAMAICQYTVGAAVANLNGSTIIDRRQALPVAAFNPQGELARIERNTDAGPVTNGTSAAAGGLSITFTLAVARYVRLEAFARSLTFSAAGGYATVEIRDQANTPRVDGVATAVTVTGGVYVSPAFLIARTVSLAAGTYTITVWLNAYGGANATWNGSTNSPSWIAAYDAHG